ncbi:MAG: nitroreductase family protein [Candidatus Bathyarchaeia archaeon]
MEFKDVIGKRRTIRKYKPDPVPEEKVKYVLEAARLAPSWANWQGWRFIIVKDEDLRKKIHTVTRQFVQEAPMFIVGCADPSKSGFNHGMRFYLVDVAIAMHQLMLAAAEQGLGTSWVCTFDEEALKEMLGIPRGIRVAALTPLGYAAEEPEPKPRKPLDELTSLDHW